MLPHPVTAEALADAAAEPDPGSLAAAQRLRRHHPPEVAAAALEQVTLRRRASGKFGDRAASLFFTRDGLEQATRPSVAAHHAGRFVLAGVRRVIDLGCGIGSDAMAFAEAGLEVIAVERDPHTAEIAAANLAGRAEVITGDAEEVADALIGAGDGVFLDPARRTTSGRLWRTEDFTPRWAFVTALLDGSRTVGIKLGPALPHREIPAAVEAEWVSDRGETVEVSLWSGPGSVPDSRSALIMPDHRLVADRTGGRPAVAGPGRFLYEPDGAVIRSGAITVLGEELGAWLLDDQIAYLSADRLTPTPYATAFEISEVLPYSEKILRRWVHDHDIGRLEIKKRGIDGDPAALRRRLKPAGDQEATMIISRTPVGARVLIGRRVR
ncbi:class I SAM-dependent methyltransferase [Microlunatus sp. Gsoil 973]|uniref:class I SAM-dependent methyltransferase n=1 Tax=Microlunatus sp. Gsoil 973 TaxID=2672569 RepID=UPI0012B499AD|nr:class I SAM-dependent methyltransferase [Microlunatus sp. Gsoil 973]QGN35125.1 methyltransferase domain-containing protein [Microlunatus sp. Gsoil 973]